MSTAEPARRTVPQQLVTVGMCEELLSGKAATMTYSPRCHSTALHAAIQSARMRIGISRAEAITREGIRRWFNKLEARCSLRFPLRLLTQILGPFESMHDRRCARWPTRRAVVGQCPHGMRPLETLRGATNPVCTNPARKGPRTSRFFTVPVQSRSSRCGT